jgi:hypothetical protein
MRTGAGVALYAEDMMKTTRYANEGLGINKPKNEMR